MPTLADLLAPYRSAPDITAADVRRARTGRTRPLVVLDDHASGTQSVANLPVVTGWSPEDLAWALSQDAPAVIVETGTRAMRAADTEVRDFDVTRAALAAANQLNIDIDIALRSDSTLRGHYPLETDVIAACIHDDANHHVDGLIMCPAYPEAGRITVGATHYVRDTDGIYHPVAQTAFARGPDFPFSTSNIPQWIHQRTGGRINAEDVLCITLDLLRSGPDAVSNLLMQARRHTPVVVDAVSEADLRCLAIALYRAEARGRRFLFRISPQFIRAYLGLMPPPVLSGSDIAALRGEQSAAAAKTGLIIASQATGAIEEQLHVLRRRRALREVEINVPALLDHRRDQHIAEVAARLIQGLQVDHTVARLSREGEAGISEFRLQPRIATALLAIIRDVQGATPLRFVVSRGQMIANTVAQGLGVRRAWVRGALLDEGVSLWQADGGPADGVPFAVYAGSLGDDQALADVVDKCANLTIPPREIPTDATVRTKPARGTRIAVIGLGATGLPIAAHLAEHFSLSGYDIAENRRQAAWHHDVPVALSIADAVAGADYVLLNLRDITQVRQVCFDPDDGIIGKVPAGTVVVLCTTVGIHEAEELAAELSAAGIHLVDAPVAGSPDQARTGRLLIAAGASPQAFDAAAPVLEAMAERIVHVGHKPGSGQAMKTVNALLTGIQVLAGAEALSFASALGLQRDVVVDYLSAADTASHVLTQRTSRMARGPQPGDPVHRALGVTLKDLGIVAATAYQRGVGVPLAGLAEQLFLLAQRSGWAEEDDSAIIRLTEPEGI
ncbi:MAG: four-carbon acid sugar kinase family protein [Bowdeniella nasicola]|nr:four-carbon acid sugar kinase family protein [Bowdeniella nasicola]